MLNDGSDRRGTALQANRLNQLARHRRTEGQTHGANGQTGGVGVFTLAAEIGRKRLAHLILITLLILAGQAIGHDHALAIDQGHLAARSQAAITGQHDIVLRVLGGILVPVPLLEHGIAILALNQLHRNALTHAFRRAPDALLEAVCRGSARQAQRKVLLLINLFIGVRCDISNLRATRLKLIAGSARQYFAIDSFELRIERSRAAHASGQILGEVKHPFLFAVPAALPLGSLSISALQVDGSGGLGVAKAHSRCIKLHDHLPHLAHITLRAELAHTGCMCSHGAQAPQQTRIQQHAPARCMPLRSARLCVRLGHTVILFKSRH